MDLEALRLAEAFFAQKPQALPSVRAFLLGALERWPETEIVTQKSQVGLRDPRPYCALTAPGKRVKGRPAPGALLSLFLPRPLETDLLLMAVEAYPGRFTNHLILPEAPEASPPVPLGLDRRGPAFSLRKGLRRPLAKSGKPG